MVDCGYGISLIRTIGCGDSFPHRERNQIMQRHSEQNNNNIWNVPFGRKAKIVAFALYIYIFVCCEEMPHNAIQLLCFRHAAVLHPLEKTSLCESSIWRNVCTRRMEKRLHFIKITQLQPGLHMTSCTKSTVTKSYLDSCNFFVKNFQQQRHFF